MFWEGGGERASPPLLKQLTFEPLPTHRLLSLFLSLLNPLLHHLLLLLLLPWPGIPMANASHAVSTAVSEDSLFIPVGGKGPALNVVSLTPYTAHRLLPLPQWIRRRQEGRCKRHNRRLYRRRFHASRALVRTEAILKLTPTQLHQEPWYPARRSRPRFLRVGQVLSATQGRKGGVGMGKSSVTVRRVFVFGQRLRDRNTQELAKYEYPLHGPNTN